ncbi:CDP-diacylglycerol--glycerol-3-phosphate 3-phosphatidyltransferase [Austwickia chelonae]|uniref:Phosphatidylinositol phosphate synthase n=1 Tax=Austwickia chelonae NBRC 105200 TaxID=1184607 RepID=K6VLD4_9MICO|nr:CDP-alcohol phosphatidyltransferase family protein [Austwickia chelonae]GAB77509.1 putative phosphatidylinositol synthase [Austwickia chelonae NBRC 105200]SEW11773.1 CDP-diacylglycerol--glycerol-3-phosphate 3-phosphatidyltransferase [Austwickia chelonae]
MLNRFARAFITRLLTPVARVALRLGLSPDMVTVIGTIGVCVGALGFYPRHEFLVGTLVIVAFVFSDTLDGTMARISGRTSTWGAFLDSTLDRIGDGAVFGGLLLCFASRPGGQLTAWFALACLVFGFVTSYARARAESLGVEAANVGIAERADRLVVALLATGLTGLFSWPDMVLTVTLGLLSVASAITVLQRMMAVRRHILAGSS